MKAGRRQFLKTSGIFSVATLLPWHRLMAASNPDEPVYVMKELRGYTGIFTERGGTIGWLIKDSGVAVVDAQFPEQAGHLIGEIKKRTNRHVDILFNTHHHGDHTSGNIAFKGFANQIVAQENSKKNQRESARKRGTENKQLYPDTTFKKNWSGKAGDEPLKAYYYGPAHTNGDSVIHFENTNIVHVGDLVFNRRYPFIDKPAGASIQNWIVVLQKIQKQFDHDTLFIFGHASDPYEVTGKHEDLKAMENYLACLLSFGKKKIKAGTSKEEFLKAQFIPGAEEWKGKGIERSLTAVWEELHEQ